jgi:hypothetical protein
VAGWQVAASTRFYAVFAATAALRATFGLTLLAVAGSLGVAGVVAALLVAVVLRAR